MKRKFIALLLLLAPLAAIAGDAPLITRIGRVVLAVNDQASYGSYGSTFEAMITRSIPVVLDVTVQAQDNYFYTTIWSDLRANRPLSERLYSAAQDFQFKRVVSERIKAALAGAPATVIDSPEVNAVLTRASINLPVKFVAAELGPIEKPGVSKAKNYTAWEQAVVDELRKTNAADTLLVTNVLLWGIKMGGTKCEQQTGGQAAWRTITTSNLGNLENPSCARVLLHINNRLINVADGKAIAYFNSHYVIEGGSTEQYLADSAAAFERDSACLVNWYAENLKRVLNGTEELKEYQCAPPETPASPPPSAPAPKPETPATDATAPAAPPQ